MLATKTFGPACAALALCASLSAASAKPAPAARSEAERPPVLDTAYLIGSWVPAEGNNACGTNMAITFRPDGTWTALGDEGTFRVEGNRILFETIFVAEGSDAGAGTHRVTVLGRDRYRSRIEGRGELTMLRCQ